MLLSTFIRRLRELIFHIPNWLAFSHRNALISIFLVSFSCSTTWKLGLHNKFYHFQNTLIDHISQSNYYSVFIDIGTSTVDESASLYWVPLVPSTRPTGRLGAQTFNFYINKIAFLLVRKNWILPGIVNICGFALSCIKPFCISTNIERTLHEFRFDRIIIKNIDENVD